MKLWKSPISHRKTFLQRLFWYYSVVLYTNHKQQLKRSSFTIFYQTFYCNTYKINFPSWILSGNILKTKKDDVMRLAIPSTFLSEFLCIFFATVSLFVLHASYICCCSNVFWLKYFFPDLLTQSHLLQFFFWQKKHSTLLIQIYCGHKYISIVFSTVYEMLLYYK